MLRSGSRTRGLAPCFELIEIVREVPWFSAGASFLLPGFLRCPILKFWGARIVFLRFTLLNNSLRWTLSLPIFDVAPRALQEFDGVIRSNCPTSRRIDFLGRQSWDIQPNCLDSFSKATDLVLQLFFDFLLGCPLASVCLDRH